MWQGEASCPARGMVFSVTVALKIYSKRVELYENTRIGRRNDPKGWERRLNKTLTQQFYEYNKYYILNFIYMFFYYLIKQR
jgi:hypothetical protein